MTKLEKAAAIFIHELVNTISQARPAETSSAARRSRAAPVDPSAMLKWLGKHGPARSEAIREGLGCDRKDVVKLLKTALADKQIKVVSGQKRATTYGLAGKSTKKPAKPTKSTKPIKPVKKPTKKPAETTKVKAKAITRAAAPKKAKAKPVSNGVTAPAVAAPPAETSASAIE